MNRRRQDGFVLIAVIWFVALIALAATIISGWLSDSLQRASALKDRIVGEQALISGTDEVAFLLTSGYFTQNSLVHIGAADAKVAVSPLGFTPPSGAPITALDGRPYRFGTGVVELQDRKGLYNLTSINPYTFEHLVGYFGISPQDASGLLDKLLDYEHANTTLQHLNGANLGDYRVAGLAPPRNARLITPWEVYRVLSWDRYHALWSGSVGFGDLTTVDPDTQGFNPNTAPPALLLGLPGMNQDGVNKVIAYREKQPITNLLDLEGAAGLVLPVEFTSVSAFPANGVRATIAFPNDPLAREVEFTLPPASAVPYRIDYAVDVPQEPALRAALATPDLPPFPDLLSAR